jgi:hypothetical protein
VSEFIVNPICSGSVANRAKTRLGTTPTAVLPLKMASPDTVGKKNRQAWTARFRSAAS